MISEKGTGPMNKVMGTRNERDRCIMCGTCTTVCPLSVSLGSGEYLGPAQFSQQLPRAAHNLSQFSNLTYLCTYCRRCLEVCPGHVDTPRVVQNLRGKVCARKEMPDMVSSLTNAISEHGNIYGMRQRERLLWSMMVEELVTPHVGVTGDVVYFLGCQTSFSGQYASVAESMVRIMDAAGERFVLLGEKEWCCGAPLWMLGLDEAAEAAAERNISAITSTGADRVICACPSCYHVLKDHLGSDVEVIHHSQYIAQLIEEGRIALDRTYDVVTYHDPCEIGRGAGLFDAPRQVLKNVAHHLVEPERHGMDAVCCGSGGGMRVTRNEASEAIADERVRELLDTGATIVATACQTCLGAISQGIERSGSDAQAADIVELVAKNIRPRDR